MGRFADAVAAYEAGLKVEPGLAMLVKGLDDAKAQAQRGGGGGGPDDGLGNLFSRPDLLQKIAGNPQTAGFLADPTFIAKLEELKRDPQSINKCACPPHAPPRPLAPRPPSRAPLPGTCRTSGS